MDLSVLDKVPYFIDAFAKLAQEMPDATLLVDDQYYQGWTRGHVDELSGKVYGYLKEHGVGKEDFVLICLPRGVLPIVAMIGVWKAGAACVVVEDNYAPERIAFIKRDCGCKVTIDLELFKQIGEESTYLPGYERADDHDAAYAVYTSGSTGRPKGVVHEYGNIKLDALCSNLRAKPGARAALVAPLNFVASLKTIFGVIYQACSLYVIPYSVIKNPVRLREYFLENKINLTFLPPALIRAVGDNFGPYLKIIHTGSEPANGIYLENAHVVNNYTMSEGGYTVCQFPIDKPYDVCPVGKPTSPFVKIRLVDEQDNDVAAGEIGEICFENPFMREYRNLPEQTAEALRGGWYHTGDLAREDEDGNIILVGRANDMIKINGNRIEPAEIEAAFKEVTGKEWAAAKGFEAPDQSYVCVYFRGELTMSDEDIREAMSAYIPQYMIPAYFMQVEAIPLLPNGKVDRKALPDPRATIKRKAYVAPRDELERKLCHAFEDAFGLENVGITEDFYELGGSSVKAMQILGDMDLDALSAVDIYQGHTVEKIAKIYREKTEGQESISEEEKEMRARKVPHMVPPIQRSVIDNQLFSPKAPMWIFPFLFAFGAEADIESVYDAACKTVENHPIFSTVFEFDEDFQLQQRYDESKRVPLQIEYMSDAELEELRASQIETFALIGEPMVKMRVIKTESNSYVLVVFHHIVMDGSSVQIIFGSLVQAYLGMDLDLDTYYSYLEDEERLRNTNAYREAYEYYRRNYDGIDWCRSIVEDKSEPGNVNATKTIETKLTPQNLATMEERCGITRNGFASAITTLALAKTSGMRDIITMFSFHNRDDKRKQHAGGLLVRSIPLGVRLDGCKTLADLYEAIKTQSRNGIAYSLYDWAIEQENAYKTDIFAVVYETADITSTELLDAIGVTLEPLDAHNEAALRRNMLQVFETKDDIRILLSYLATVHSEECIDEFARVFADYANKLIDVDNPANVTMGELL